MKSVWKAARTVLIVLICLEILLHFYNPFKEKGTVGSTHLQDYADHELNNLNSYGFSEDFTHTKNNLGFRGPELNTDSNKLKIICMGGSSTECYFLNDGKDWPSLLAGKLKEMNQGIWVNNAGFSGKTIVDHLALLKKPVLKIKPDYIFLMCGLDNIGQQIKKNKFIEKSRLDAFFHFFELPKLVKNPGKNEVAPSFKLLDLNNAEMLEMSDSLVLQRIAKEQMLINDYRSYLQEFADVCKANNIQLVLISEVILFGEERDLVSDVHLENIRIGDINGRTEALLLKQYNKTTYEIAEINQLPFINLSARLPKDSRFFYDGFHFTNEGAEMVSTIILDESKPLIKK